MRPTRCKACDAEIYFLRITKKDGSKGMVPVDAAAVRKPILYHLMEHDGELLGERARVYQSHFETCPQAARFSGGAS